MRRHFTLAILAVIWFTASAPVQGQDVKETLASIPGNALGCIVSSRLDQVNDKLAAAAKKIGIPLPLSPLDLAKATFGATKGLNAQGCAAVVILPFNGQGDTGMIMLPVSDYEEFLGQFKGKGKDIVDIEVAGLEWSIAPKGKHAWLVRKQQRDLLKAALSAKSGLTKFAQPVQEWLESNDITALVTPSGIKEAVVPAREALAQAKNALGDDANAAMVLPYLDGISSLLKMVEADVSLAALGVRLDAAGNLTVDLRSLFTKNSDLAKSAAKIPTGDPLAGLPGGPFAIAMGGAIPPSIMEGLMKWNVEAIKLAAKTAGADVPADKLGKLEQSLIALSKGMNGMALVMGAGKGEKNLFGGMSAVIRTDSAAAYLENYEKMLPQMNALYKEVKLPTSVVEKKKIGQRTVLETTSDLSAVGGNDPAQKAIMEAMFGDGKMTVSITALDAKTIIMTYTPAAGLEKVLKKGGLQKDADVARTLKLLPQGAQWVLLIDPRGTAELVSQWLGTFAPGAPLQIPELPQTPPAGVGARLTESGLTVQIVVPAQVLEVLGRKVQRQKEFN